MKRTLVIAAAALASFVAAAGEHGSRLPPNPAYLDECGGCHVAFPPALLPAESWQRLMANLPRHFGGDASLEPAQRDALAAWLQSNASRRATAAPPEDRITRAPWFVREHREVAADVWRRSSVKTASNCGACHGGAAAGNYDEHAVRVPR
jgi:mono/diheme cytochrome c family protein